MTEFTYRVRWYQGDFHRALVNRTRDRLMAVWHRRAGKDDIVMNAMRERALKDPGTYWHCFPEYKQARKAIWNGVNGHTGKRRIFEAFPERIIKRMQDDDMFIELQGGGTYQLIGSDNYDNTVGSGPKGIAYSEWGLSNPSAWAYHSPMIRETKGFAAFITTPRGRNHAKTMYDTAVANPDVWFSQLLTAQDTGTLSNEELEAALKEYVDLYGPDLGKAIFEQEYLCSFNAAIMGAFYGGEMAKVRASGRIAAINAIPGIPVHTAWDIGVRDETSIWWFQIFAGRVLVLACYTNSGAGVDHYAAKDEEIRAEYGWARTAECIDWVPHDAKVREWGTTGARTRLEAMRLHGLNPSLVPGVSKLDGINAVRMTLKTCVFHPRCEDVGIPALETYRREWDDGKKAFKATEVHDWACHLADAFRYLALVWRAAAPKEEPPKPTLQRGQVILDIPELDQPTHHKIEL